MRDQVLICRPIILLQAEGFCSLFGSCLAFHLLFPHHWLMFACLFLLPDLTLLAYLRPPSAGAGAVYNLMHSYVLPVLLGMLAIPGHNRLFGELSLIWIAHISMDRMLGYGLKYPTSFRFTHIQSAGNDVIAPHG